MFRPLQCGTRLARRITFVTKLPLRTYRSTTSHSIADPSSLSDQSISISLPKDDITLSESDRANDGVSPNHLTLLHNASSDPSFESKRTTKKANELSRDRIGRKFIAPSASGITVGGAKKDDPHSLLVRAGYIRQSHAGVYHFLPLGLEVMNKISDCLRNTLADLGASEVSLSSISSEELWKKSGRIEQSLEPGQHEFMTVQDRKDSGYILSPTHEEEITTLVSNMTNSYKDFPLRLYQITRKYRDELRPRQGLLRTKEFMMKDLYTFDIDERTALDTYRSVRAAYRDFFEQLGVPYVEVEASSGTMGGSLSHEYHFLSPLGEDTVIICESCGFAANEEILGGKNSDDKPRHQCPRCTSDKVSSHRAIEVGHTFHLGTRYTEPLKLFVSVPRTLIPEDPSVSLSQESSPEISPQDSGPQRVPLQMGCHGIGVSRLIGAVAAMTSDDKGLRWPIPMAPAQAIIVFDGKSPSLNPTRPDEDLIDAHAELKKISFRPMRHWPRTPLEVVVDDREKPLPWKLKDADMIGYPLIIVMGRHWRETGEFEIQCRSRPELSGKSPLLKAYAAGILNALAPEVSKLAGEVSARMGNSTPQEYYILHRLNPRLMSKRPKATSSSGCEQSNESREWEQPDGKRSLIRKLISDDPLLREHEYGKHTSYSSQVRKPETTEKASTSECAAIPKMPTIPAKPKTPKKRTSPKRSSPSEQTSPSALTREHLLERIGLLERLMTLRAEEDRIKKQSGKG